MYGQECGGGAVHHFCMLMWLYYNLHALLCAQVLYDSMEIWHELVTKLFEHHHTAAYQGLQPLASKSIWHCGAERAAL